jgi:hypothetical protein
MPTSRAGLRQLGFCDSGTLLTAPVNPIVMGLRDKATMVTDMKFKQNKDYRNRVLPNMIGFKLDCESLQPSMAMLKALIGWLNSNCDIQAITFPQSPGAANGDVYQFAGANQAGLDFEYLITQDKRSLKATIEIAMEYARAQAFIDAADSASPVVFAGIVGSGADFTKYRAPYFISFEAPKATALFGGADLVARSYSIKTKNKKSIYNASIVDYLTFNFMIQARDASVATQIAKLATVLSPSVYVKEQNGTGLFDAFDFNAGVLTLDSAYNDSDDERSLTLTFSADVSLSDIAFQFGATYGGDVADTTGVKGGTMKVGY